VPQQAWPAGGMAGRESRCSLQSLQRQRRCGLPHGGMCVAWVWVCGMNCVVLLLLLLLQAAAAHPTSCSVQLPVVVCDPTTAAL
jgi:hypothetical protein